MFWGKRILPATLAVSDLDLDAPPGALLDDLAARDDPVLLESAALHADYGRYSLLACCPLDVLSLERGALRNRDGHVLADRDRGAFWRALRDAFGAVGLTEPAPASCPPYLPGWSGYVGYEVGHLIERLPQRARRDTALSDLRLAFHDAVLVYDALQRHWQLVELVFRDPPSGAGRAAEALRQLARRARGRQAAGPRAVELSDPAARAAEESPAANFSPSQYRQAVARCVEYIAAGDIFQVNLSQRFTVAAAPAPLEVYRSLRRRNPAWYAAYLAFSTPRGPCAVLSSSPELFLRVRDGHVTTRPIKGTRPRTGDARDAQAAADLLASPKDNAELAMIIDLLRNDLGRVCRYGTVRVTERRRLETHPTVFHLVGTVEGDLYDGVGPAELLRATFPGGSITGAPKIRAMEIIDELEDVARGVYTGCIGHVGVDASCEWNIAIRTVVWDRGAAHVQVGGGIVADSQPLGEYNETLDKARALLEAIREARACSSARPVEGPPA